MNIGCVKYAQQLKSKKNMRALIIAGLLQSSNTEKQVRHVPRG